MDHSIYTAPEHNVRGNEMMGSSYRCQMSMLFTWNPENLCLVFRWWHISNTFTLIFSLLGVVALSAGYELVRELSRRYEARINSVKASIIIPDNESSLLLPARTAFPPMTAHIGTAVFYGVQVFYSFFIMLLFMTYNGWVMIAVAVGASLGYFMWGRAPGTRLVTCH